MGSSEIERFLNHLAINRKVSAATQNQALSAELDAADEEDIFEIDI